MNKYVELKPLIDEKIAAYHGELAAFSDDLADHPETALKEYETSKKIVALLQAKGFDTEYPYAGFDTRGHFSVSETPCRSLWERWPASAGRRGFCRAAWAGAKKRGPEKSAPTHLSYHTPVCKSTAKWPGSFKICGLHKNRCLHLGNIPS